MRSLARLAATGLIAVAAAALNSVLASAAYLPNGVDTRAYRSQQC